MRSPQLALHNAMYQYGVANLSTPLFERVSDGVARPYIAFAEMYETPLGDKASKHRQVIVNFRCYSDKIGSNEVQTMMNDLIQTFAEVPLTISTWQWIDTVFRDSTNVGPDVVGDEIVERGDVSFNVQLQDLT